MADSRYISPGASIGGGRVRGFRNRDIQRLTGGRQHINELVVDPSQPMSDIPAALLRINTASEALGRGVRQNKDMQFDRPLSVVSAKINAPDTDCHGFDFETIPLPGIPNVAAATQQFALLQRTTSNVVRGVIKKVGWYTTAAGAPWMQFGLYVGDQLVVPGSRLLPDRPRTILEFNPSGSSIASAELAATTEAWPTNTEVRVLVSNTDPLNAHPAWCRIWGWLWDDQAREDGRRSYFNTQVGRIV